MKLFKWMYLAILMSLFAFNVYAQKKNVKYEYKKYEKFDLSTMDIGATASAPGDLSISPRFRKKFRNKIPERRNFNEQMRNAIDSIR
jgi:hypothetical protein